MSDYIDREELVGWLTRPSGFRANCEDCASREDGGEIDCLDCILEDVIKVAPAVDAQEIKHGEWIKYYPQNALDGVYFCSNCFKIQDIADGMITPLDRGYHYCPNCGAKMDGGNNNA